MEFAAIIAALVALMLCVRLIALSIVLSHSETSDMPRYYVEITTPTGNTWTMEKRSERSQAFRDLAEALETVPVDSVLRVRETGPDTKTS